MLSGHRGQTKKAMMERGMITTEIRAATAPIL
jgi:hypothetical protein